MVQVGLSHRTARVELREQLAVCHDDIPTFIDELVRHTPVTEAMVLSTCNRVEVYAALPRGHASDDATLDEVGRAVASRLAHRGTAEVAAALVRRRGLDALHHLFRVASSLDSLVVGEPQILGQLKDAITVATEHGTLGPVLGKVLHRALFVGKRVRTETQIGAGQVSVSSVAVDLALQIFGDLNGKTALMVGAGEMAESAAKLLVKEGARLLVVNRSIERATKLAAEVGGVPHEWGQLNWSLIDADIVVSSTSSPHFVITHDAMKTAKKARRGRSLFLIDIAVPRDIDPAVASLDGVYRYDIDDLEQIVADSLAGRAAEAEKAEGIVLSEVRAFEVRAAELAMNPVIVGLRARIRAALNLELERSLAGKLKHLGATEREALGVMIDAATNKICHRPSARLRALANDPRGFDAVETLTDLFDLPEAPSHDGGVDEAEVGGRDLPHDDRVAARAKERAS
ncbi:MAG: glutamyl-tRNA reductase [Polyangiaceae bacterium]|nr:glutamyl-tRNA reductase [Polyangiaceae bacterium]